ncbi:MAG TPA: hypothetical protein DDW52_13095 [Planctomycetaceae bacterium]|nr:hypothetical protein [Planctomycetaceae bacterium]
MQPQIVHPLLYVCLLALTSWAGAADRSEQIEFFESRIRPILAQECYACHSSNGDADGGLILDHRNGLLKGGDRGPAIVPGKPDQSLLIRAIRHEVADLEMPSAAPKLDEVIIRDFEHWIKIGAPDPRERPPTDEELDADSGWLAVMERKKAWWSFQPIAEVPPPQLNAINHPIDQFIQDSLDEAGLEPSGPAEPSILVRRLTFALTGLPPTEEQLLKFTQQTNRTAATNDLIDELLDSPHFGERWARHWMDWIRYAESHGSEGDPRIENAYIYRDYLIRALNSDIPYDQLLREHIAGDLLDNPRLNHDLEINESLIGIAHWRMVFHGFAPTDALDEKVRFTDDQINVFSKAFLGLTVSCARCHNHKFDAISQADYYALFGILGSTRPGRTAIDLPAKQNTNLLELTDLKAKIRHAVADAWMDAAEELSDHFPDDSGSWPKDSTPTSPLHLMQLLKRESESPNSFAEAWQEQVQNWESYQESSDAYRGSEFPFRAEFSSWYREGTGLGGEESAPGDFSIQPDGDRVLLGIYPAGVYSHLLSQKHAARLSSPDFSIEDNSTLWLRVIGDGNAMARYVVQNYPRDGTVYPIKRLQNEGKPKWQWVRYDVGYWAGDEIHIELSAARDAPLLTRPSDRSWFGISDAVLVPEGELTPIDSKDFLGPIFDAAKSSPPRSASDLEDIYISALKQCIDAWKRGAVDNEMASFLNACLQDGLLPNTLQELDSARALIDRYRKLESDIPIPTRVPTLAEWRASDQPLFDRGNHKKPLDTVPRRFLEAIDATPYQTEQSGRLELAEDLLRDDNPFTRRVIVNRVWHHLFGQGIVPSVDNFGRMGDKPTHPELLDYLAHRFAEDGWSLKNLIRLIVTCNTWQQASKSTLASRESDPGNLLLSHFRVQRLDAESIRDSLLVAAGVLDPTLYGPPVDGRQNRRSVYVPVIRNQLDPFLGSFDAPVPFATKGRRDVTTVPAQSLALFNDPFVLDLAKRAGTPTGDTRDFVRKIWRRLLGRDPSPQEQQQALRLVESLQVKYAALQLRRKTINKEIANSRDKVGAIRTSIRSKLLEAQGNRVDENRTEPEPISHWNFEGDLNDSTGDLDAELKGTAQLKDGALFLDGGGWASTPPLTRKLKAKTLQARVQLDTLNQRGGGVVTIQTLDGKQFDSIVFGELQRHRWLAGSDFHRRTEAFSGIDEQEAAGRPIVFTIVYQADGTIIGYRDGEPYGRAYKTSVQTFEANNAQVVFGIRHGTSPGGNRMLRGQVLDATLFDRALTPEEVLASATGDRRYISTAMVDAAMTPAQRRTVEEMTRTITMLESELASLGEPVSDTQAYADLALAIFNMKEFIYVR